MLIRTTAAERNAILRAMATVATGRGLHPLSDADAVALAAANHVVLGDADDLDPRSLAAIAAGELAAALKNDDTRAAATKFLAVMALVDGALNASRLEVASSSTPSPVRTAALSIPRSSGSRGIAARRPT